MGILPRNDDMALMPAIDRDGRRKTGKAYQVWADALTLLFQELLGHKASEDYAPAPTGDPSAQRATQ